MFSCCTGDDNDPDGDSINNKRKKSRKSKHQNSTDYFIDYYRESLSPTNNSSTQDSPPPVRNPKLPYIKSSEYYEGVPEFEQEESSTTANKSKRKTVKITPTTPAKKRGNLKRTKNSDDSDDDDLITVEFDDDDEQSPKEIDDDDDDQPIPHLSHDGRKVIWYPPYDPPPVPLPPSLMWTGKRRRSRSRSPSSQQHRQSLSPKERGMMRIVSRNQQKNREQENEEEPTLARSVAKRVAIENGQYVTVFVDTGNTSNDRSGKQKRKKQNRGKGEKLTPSEELQFLIEEMKDTIEDFHEHHIHHPSRKMIPELEGKLLAIVSAVEQVMSTSSFTMSSSSVVGTNTPLSTRDIEKQLTQVHSPLYDKIFGPSSEQHSSSIALPPTSSLVRANEKEKEDENEEKEFEKQETLAWMLNEAGFVMDACSHLLSSSSSTATTLEQENYYHQQILIRWKEYELQMYRFALQIYEKLYEGQDNQNFALAVSNVGTTLIELEEERMNYYQMTMMLQSQQEGTQERSPSLPTLEELVNTNPAFIEGIQLIRLSLSMNQNVYSFICEQLSGERSPSSSSNILLRTQEEQEEMNDISQEFASCLREAGQIFSRLGLVEDAVGVLRQQVEVLSACHEQNETRKRRLKLLNKSNDEDENHQDNETRNSHMMVDLSWIAAALNELGFCLLEAKRIDEGLDYQLQALHIMRDRLQPNERDENNLAKLMNNCGFYLCESKKGRREGLPLLRESIELKRRLLFEEQLEMLRRDPNSSKKQLLKKITKEDPQKAMKNMANLRPSETFGVMLWNLGLQYEKMIADLMDEVNERLEREDNFYLGHEQPEEHDERKFILATVGDDDDHQNTNLNNTKIVVDCHEANEDEDEEVDKTSLVDCNSDDEEHQQRAETDLNHDRSILPEEFYHHEVQLVAEEQQQQQQIQNKGNLQIQHHYDSSPTSFVFTPEERKLYMNFVTLGLEAHSEALEMFQRVHSQETAEEENNEDVKNKNNSNPWIIKTRGKVGKMMVLESNLKKENFGLVTSHKTIVGNHKSANNNLFKETPRRS